jgi:hypothetical protein
MTEEEIKLRTRLLELETILQHHLKEYRSVKFSLDKILIKNNSLATKWRLSPEQLLFWSEERIAVVQRDWPTYTPTEVILAHINSLPGRLVPYRQLLSLVHRNLFLQRPPDYTSVMNRARSRWQKAPLCEILEWGRCNFVSRGKTDEESVLLINTKRQALNLPQFKVIRVPQTETKNRACYALS